MAYSLPRVNLPHTNQQAFRLILAICLFASLTTKGQTKISGDTTRPTIPMNRVLWHEQIDKEQKRIDKMDGKTDGFTKLTSNDDINAQVADAVLRRVDELQLNIERMQADQNIKVGYLRGVKELLQEYQKQTKGNRELAAQAPLVIESYDKIGRAHV